MAFDIKKLDDFPTLPGVYLMRDADGKVIYVGKAKNIRQRVKQYFLKGRDGREMVPFLVSRVASIDTIVVSSEKEALLFENNLIKQHQPRYNAFLKDDKTYIAIKMTKHSWPMLQLVRYRGKPKADGQYFGPYTSAHSARETFDLLQRIFPLRQCSNEEFIRRTRPCILYDMKRCCAPCVQKCSKEEYDLLVKSTIQFLKGQDQEVLKNLYAKMHSASEALEFEEAATIYQTIKHIEKTIENQSVDKPLGGNLDAFGIFRQGEEVVVSQMFMRGGKLVGARHKDFTKIGQDDSELLESFLMQEYEGRSDIPNEILLPIEMENADALSEILSTNQKYKINVFKPQRGEKRALVDMAEANAKASFHRVKDMAEIKEKILMEMKETFSLNRYPKRIECVDNSNLSGSEQVSSIVSIVEGEKDKKNYRHYKVKSASASDDYGSMREVLIRRYQRGKEEGNLPDLLIVDGGKGHLNIALKVFQELDIVNVDIISLAKEEGRHDQGATLERIFLPNLKDPIILKRNSQILFFLQQIRDEAHRFVIGFQRKRRSKKNMSSVLDELPGIAATRRKQLLRHFGSVKKLLEATEDDVKAIPNIPSTIKTTLWEFILKKRIL